MTKMTERKNGMTSKKDLVCPQHGKTIANYVNTVFPTCNICMEKLVEKDSEV